MYKIQYRKSALKALKKLPVKITQAFRENFELLAKDIERKDLNTKKLSGREGYRLRVGAYRAIYMIENDALLIIVIKIGSRGDIYK